MPNRPSKLPVFERRVALFRDGCTQTVCIPREFELEGKEALMSKQGYRLILAPVRKTGLIDLLASWEPLDDDGLSEVENLPAQERPAL